MPSAPRRADTITGNIISTVTDCSGSRRTAVLTSANNENGGVGLLKLDSLFAL